ncbi:hypothetical protein [Nocardia sp. CA-119907]|uniref:hypothetical protein n=1 Tax=Nocardia sp. CA-119907 TaxID=3239973 RepID=UPI003D9529B7
MVMPGTWMSPRRSTLIRARELMGLGPKAFAERLNDVIGPVEFPRCPVTWQAVRVWETELQPPQFVVDAALVVLRVSNTDWAGNRCRVVDLDEARTPAKTRTVRKNRMAA